MNNTIFERNLKMKKTMFVSLIALFSVMPLFAMGSRGTSPDRPMKMGMKAKVLKEKLSLTDAQMEELKNLRIAANKDFEKERKALDAERDRLISLKAKGELSRVKIEEALTAVGNIQRNIHEARMKNTAAVIAVFTDEQLYKAIDSRIMEHLFMPPRGKERHKRDRKGYGDE